MQEVTRSIFKQDVTFEQLSQRCTRSMIMAHINKPFTLHEIVDVKCATGIQIVTNYAGEKIYTEVNKANLIRGIENKIDLKG